MRCHDFREWLGAQLDGDLLPSDAQAALEEHLQTCSSCRAFKAQQHLLHAVTYDPAPRTAQRTGISTERIMLAIQQQKYITSQLENIRQRQQSRMVHLRSVGTACVALCCFTLSSIPLLLLALCLAQTDLTVKALYILNNIIDVSIILAQYLQVGLTMMTRNNWLLSALAFAVIVMIGMWLRLMRHPQGA